MFWIWHHIHHHGHLGTGRAAVHCCVFCRALCGSAVDSRSSAAAKGGFEVKDSTSPGDLHPNRPVAADGGPMRSLHFGLIEMIETSIRSFSFVGSTRMIVVHW